MSFTIYTKEGAQAVNPSYFKRLPQSHPGPQRVMLGRALPALHAGYSLIIVRVVYRTLRQAQYLNRKRERKIKAYFVTQRVEYVVATINWDSGHVTELAVHPARATAEADMRTRHATR